MGQTNQRIGFDIDAQGYYLATGDQVSCTDSPLRMEGKLMRLAFLAWSRFNLSDNSFSQSRAHPELFNLF